MLDDITSTVFPPRFYVQLNEQKHQYGPRYGGGECSQHGAMFRNSKNFLFFFLCENCQYATTLPQARLQIKNKYTSQAPIFKHHLQFHFLYNLSVSKTGSVFRLKRRLFLKPRFNLVNFLEYYSLKEF